MPTQERPVDAVPRNVYSLQATPAPARNLGAKTFIVQRYRFDDVHEPG